MFEHVLVPGLFQTPEYARAVLSTRPHTTSDELESLVAARLARQVVLDRKDLPLLRVVLDEGVLHRPVGTPEVMGAQLRRLAALCDEAYVTLHGSAQVRVKVCTQAPDVHGLASRDGSTVSAR